MSFQLQFRRRMAPVRISQSALTIYSSFLFIFFVLDFQFILFFFLISFPMLDVSESTTLKKSVPIPHICVPLGPAVYMYVPRCDSQHKYCYFCGIDFLCSYFLLHFFFSLPSFFGLTQFPSTAVKRPSEHRCHPRPSMTAPCCSSPCPLGYTRRCPTTHRR